MKTEINHTTKEKEMNFYEMIVNHFTNLNGRKKSMSELQNGSELEIWIVNGKVLLLYNYGNGNGCEVFIPADTSNNIDSTMEAVNDYIK